MAFETIGTYRVYEYEQEEIKETKQVAGSDGVVSEVTTLYQEYAHFWADLIVKQQRLVNENRSVFEMELWLYANAGDSTKMGEGFTVGAYIGNRTQSHIEFLRKSTDTFAYAGKTVYSRTTLPGDKVKHKLNPGDETLAIKIGYINSDNIYLNVEKGRKLAMYHNLDGTVPSTYLVTSNTIQNGLIGISSEEFDFLNVGWRVYFWAEDLLRQNTTNTSYQPDRKGVIQPTALPIENRGVYPVIADNFTDEENPSFTYTPITSLNYFSEDGSSYTISYWQDTITSLQAALSFDGETADIAYRNISADGSSYTFNLTEAEREKLRVKAQGSPTVPIYYLIKTTRSVTDTNTKVTKTVTFNTVTERTLTIVGCKPTLNPTVRDVNSDTVALTGNANTFIRYESMAEFSTGATASKHATIVSQSVQCGSKTIYNLYNGVIDDVESNSFIFNATDSRGLHADQVVVGTTMIDYVKPTCKQVLKIEIVGETGAAVNLTASGNYFNGSFGKTNNTFKLEVRHTDDNGTMGNWQTISDTPTFNGSTYEISSLFTGFNYGKGYTFQTRLTDKLNVVETSQYTIKFLPVFDWSAEDFNFNVPININGKTIIRHNSSSNNSVLSASGGKVYIRPGGTDNQSGETIFNKDGSVKFSGNVDLTQGFTIAGASLADYVIETGETAMGSNGTWYWRKWASGKAEAWGCRNFGNAAVTTAWGNLYRSAIFTQDLPSGVFVRTPDSININIVHSNYGGWICKHEQTAPSAATTGSFIFVRPASATVTPTNIGFHVIGEWQ